MKNSGENFFNTIGETGKELKASMKKAKTQEERILVIFQPDILLTPFQVHKVYVTHFAYAPITSIRRAISVLTRKGKLIKTAHLRDEQWGKPNYLWKINKR